jgi:hypothetical protein
MTADAILLIAIGPLLLLAYPVYRAVVLAQVALRDGGEVEMEVKAASLYYRIRAGRPCPGNPGEGDNTAQAAATNAESKETGGSHTQNTESQDTESQNTESQDTES